MSSNNKMHPQRHVLDQNTKNNVDRFGVGRVIIVKNYNEFTRNGVNLIRAELSVSIRWTAAAALREAPTLGRLRSLR